MQSNWPTAEDFIFRKRRRPGRRARRASKLDAKGRKLDAKRASDATASLVRDMTRASNDRAYSAPTPRVNGADPFQGRCCPGCDLTLDASNPPIDLVGASPDVSWLDGHCIRCVMSPEVAARAIIRRQRGIVASVTISDPAFARYLRALRNPVIVTVDK